MKRLYFGTIALCGVLALGVSSGAPIFGASQDPSVLKQQIEAQKQRIQEIQSEANRYRTEIRKREAQQVTLSNEIGILENRVAATELDIKALENEIESTIAEIQLLEKGIADKNVEIAAKKKLVASLIRDIHESEQTSYLEVLLNNDTFSEFFDRIQAMQNVEEQTHAAVLELKNARMTLADRKQQADDKRVSLDAARANLVKTKEQLAAQQTAKEELLAQTQDSEQRFQELLASIKREEQAAANEVQKLEGSLRKLLEQRKTAAVGSGTLQWPVSSRVITVYFKDPTYPFRRLFEHSGIDLAVPVGTPVKSPAAGYVASVRTANSYGNYITVVHAGSVSTLYAHLSKFAVKPGDYVEAGAILGYSGGKAGAPGSGLSTGPHLHFETRYNGVPVNPLTYLVAQ